MPEFKKVAAATFSPTVCALCGTHEGPFIDTHLDIAPHGHIWICTHTKRRSGCIRQMARLDDMVDRSALDEAMTLIDKQRDQIVDLEEEIASSRVVSMDEVLDYLQERRGASSAA